MVVEVRPSSFRFSNNKIMMGGVFNFKEKMNNLFTKIAMRKTSNIYRLNILPFLL